ncbi:MAG: hypothetical protein NTW03_16850 [Verrucomicrobia bacterium]|nr:hypothetical protein [Verrucomicrobiota bacterium]
MFGIKLTTLSVVLGCLVMVPGAIGVLKPGALAVAARKFPRHTGVGVVLMLLATVWFIYNVSLESLSDFSRMKDWFYLLFGGVGVGACLFVRDFLAVRGLAVVLLLLGRLMVDTARWVETDWRLVIVVWAYALVVAGIWLTISPWRLRDLIEWTTANERRTRCLSGLRLAFGMFLVLLGLTVFRAAEAKSADHAAVAPPVTFLHQTEI